MLPMACLLAACGDESEPVRTVAWMPDGRLVVVTKDGLTFVDPSGAATPRDLVLEEGTPRNLDVSQDGKKLVYGLAEQDALYVLTGF